MTIAQREALTPQELQEFTNSVELLAKKITKVLVMNDNRLTQLDAENLLREMNRLIDLFS